MTREIQRGCVNHPPKRPEQMREMVAKVIGLSSGEADNTIEWTPV